MSVIISNELALELLENRLKEALEMWGNIDTLDLWVNMYETLLDAGCWSGGSEFEPNYIVDNDVINYCKVIYKGDDDFERLYKLAESGEWDISCETFKGGRYSAIEAYNSEAILIRW